MLTFPPKRHDLDELSASDLADADAIFVIDVSDTTESPQGTWKVLRKSSLSVSLTTGVLDFKGSRTGVGDLDYPVGSKGDAYYISAAGKVGGAAGKTVEVGDMLVASADNAGGAEADVGTSWFVLQANITGLTSHGLNLMRAASVAAQKTLLDIDTIELALLDKVDEGAAVNTGVTTHNVTGTELVSQTAVETALNDLGAAINQIRAAIGAV